MTVPTDTPEQEVMIDPTTGKTIPMKNGKPCRTCVDFKTWSRLEKQKNKAEAQKTTTTQETPVTPTTQEPVTEEWRKQNCPPDVEALGNATWTLLHTTAAYYPEKPAPSQRESMKAFIESFAQHYPCWFCKNDFQQAMANEPVQVESREKLSQWLCRRHNEVNVKLNKPVFDCTKVFERWLNGPPNGKCD
ncbi:ERV/ALR sulfhydryl oxidase domain-containing protein [Chlamydoabsidia padenii]|nr:ERV/ALR sulfhydryl oxidase domain-containing protein [Chlamydoabsidia padenii]